MDFSDALHRLKRGCRIAREGWNAKGQYVYLVPAGRYEPTTPSGDDIAADQPDGKVPYAAYMALKTTRHEIAPWAPTGNDTLAEDWIDVTHGEGDLDG